ncbi:hypothetical protein BVI434_270021 [Burkholderia vietnamiensis]|nr:hypothetical protein BVI434_270021 [Burkholderia vietnamiensis]
MASGAVWFMSLSPTMLVRPRGIAGVSARPLASSHAAAQWTAAARAALR